MHRATIPDREGAEQGWEEAVGTHERPRPIWADSGSRGALVEGRRTERGIAIEIVGKRPGRCAVVAAPRRW